MRCKHSRMTCFPNVACGGEDVGMLSVSFVFCLPTSAQGHPGEPVRAKLATSVCQFRRDQMEQGPTEPHIGRSTFLLSSGGAGGGYYSVALDTGPIVTENRFPARR